MERSVFSWLLKHVLPLFLGMAILLQAFDKGLLWSGFCLNQRYIAAELCENKDKPQLHCEGHCVLRKALEKLDDQKTANHSPKEAKTEVLICQSGELLWNQPPRLICLTYAFPLDELNLTDYYPFDLFKPPIPTPLA